MDTQAWSNEAECLLRSEGLWPEDDEARARGTLEWAAQRGPAHLARTVRALRAELRERGGRRRGESASVNASDVRGEW